MWTRARPLLPALLLVAAVSAGCEGFPKPFGLDPEAATPKAGEFEIGEPFVAEDLDFAWDRGKHALLNKGYRIDPARSSRADMRLVSEWKVLLGITRYQGKRTRATVQFDPAGEGAADEWVTAVAVLSQRNTDIENPSDPLEAEWEAQPADMPRARVLLYDIESGLRRKLEETPTVTGPQRARELVEAAQPFVRRAANPDLDPAIRREANRKAYDLLTDAKRQYDAYIDSNPDDMEAIDAEYAECVSMVFWAKKTLAEERRVPR